MIKEDKYFILIYILLVLSVYQSSSLDTLNVKNTVNNPNYLIKPQNVSFIFNINNGKIETQKAQSTHKQLEDQSHSNLKGTKTRKAIKAKSNGKIEEKEKSTASDKSDNKAKKDKKRKRVKKVSSLNEILSKLSIIFFCLMLIVIVLIMYNILEKKLETQKVDVGKIVIPPMNSELINRESDPDDDTRLIDSSNT